MPGESAAQRAATEGERPRDALVSRGRSPFFKGPVARSVPVAITSGRFSRFRPISSTLWVLDVLSERSVSMVAEAALRAE